MGADTFYVRKPSYRQRGKKKKKKSEKRIVCFEKAWWIVWLIVILLPLIIKYDAPVHSANIESRVGCVSVSLVAASAVIGGVLS